MQKNHGNPAGLLVELKASFRPRPQAEPPLCHFDQGRRPRGEIFFSFRLVHGSSLTIGGFVSAQILPEHEISLCQESVRQEEAAYQKKLSEYLQEITEER